MPIPEDRLKVCSPSFVEFCLSHRLNRGWAPVRIGPDRVCIRGSADDAAGRFAYTRRVWTAWVSLAGMWVCGGAAVIALRAAAKGRGARGLPGTRASRARVADERLWARAWIPLGVALLTAFSFAGMALPMLPDAGSGIMGATVAGQRAQTVIIGGRAHETCGGAWSAAWAPISAGAMALGIVRVSGASEASAAGARVWIGVGVLAMLLAAADRVHFVEGQLLLTAALVWTWLATVRGVRAKGGAAEDEARSEEGSPAAWPFLCLMMGAGACGLMAAGGRDGVEGRLVILTGWVVSAGLLAMAGRAWPQMAGQMTGLSVAMCVAAGVGGAAVAEAGREALRAAADWTKFEDSVVLSILGAAEGLRAGVRGPYVGGMRALAPDAVMAIVVGLLAGASGTLRGEHGTEVLRRRSAPLVAGAAMIGLGLWGLLRHWAR